MTVFK